MTFHVSFPTTSRNAITTAYIQYPTPKKKEIKEEKNHVNVNIQSSVNLIRNLKTICKSLIINHSYPEWEREAQSVSMYDATIDMLCDKENKISHTRTHTQSSILSTKKAEQHKWWWQIICFYLIFSNNLSVLLFLPAFISFSICFNSSSCVILLLLLLQPPLMSFVVWYLNIYFGIFELVSQYFQHRLDRAREWEREIERLRFILFNISWKIFIFVCIYKTAYDTHIMMKPLAFFL